MEEANEALDESDMQDVSTYDLLQHPQEFDHSSMTEVTDETHNEISEGHLSVNTAFNPFEERPNAELLTKRMRTLREDGALNFEIEFTCVQGWFVRSAWTQKYNFIMTVLRDNSDMAFLKYLLRLIGIAYSKDVVYSTSQCIEAFEYDIQPFDDNRALNPESLEDAVRSAQAWFAKLSDANKLKIVVSLMLLGGGALIKRVSMDAALMLQESERQKEQAAKDVAAAKEAARLDKLRAEKLEGLQLGKSKRRSIVKKKGTIGSEKKGKKGKTVGIGLGEKIKDVTEEKPEDKNPEEMKNDVKAPGNEETDEFDKNHPLSIRALYNVEQFDKKMQKLTRKYDRGVKPKSPSVSSRGKSSRSSKKTGDNENVDQLQLLPLQINRKIMRMLSDKDLKNLKKVNRYWAYMIDEATAEKKARGKLDEALHKYKKWSGAIPKRIKITPPRGGQSIGPKSQASSTGTEATKSTGHPSSPRQIDSDLGFAALGRLVVTIESRLMKDLFATRLPTFIVANKFFRCRVAACCAKGRLVALSTADNVVELFYTNGTKLAPRLVGHGAHITCMAFHPDGILLVTGSSDTSARLWDVWKQTTVKKFRDHTDALVCACLDGDYLVTAALDKCLRVVHIWSGEHTMTVQQDDAVTAVAMSAATQTVFAGFQSGNIRMYDYMQNICHATVLGHLMGIAALDLKPPLLASSGQDGYTRVWDCKLSIPNCLVSMRHNSVVRTVCLTSNHLLVTGSHAGGLKVWNTATGRNLTFVRDVVGRRPILHVYCQQDNAGLKIVVSADTAVHVYSFKSYPPKPAPVTPAKETPPRPETNQNPPSQPEPDLVGKMPTSKKMSSAPLTPSPETATPLGADAPPPTPLESDQVPKSSPSKRIGKKSQQSLRSKQLPFDPHAVPDITVMTLSSPISGEPHPHPDPRMNKLRHRRCAHPKLRGKILETTEENIYTSMIQEDPENFAKIASELVGFKRTVPGKPEDYALPLKIKPRYRTAPIARPPFKI